MTDLNNFVQDEKESIQSVLQILTKFFTVIKVPYLNNTISFRPMNKTERVNNQINPIINSNYMSTLVHVEVETP